MPRFYFPTHDGSRLIDDEEGTDLADAVEARREAVKSLCELASDRFPAADGEAALRLDVLDSGRELLFEVRLALSLPNGRPEG